MVFRVGFYTGGASTYANFSLQFDGLISQNNRDFLYVSECAASPPVAPNSIMRRGWRWATRDGRLRHTRLLTNGGSVGLPEVRRILSNSDEPRLT